MNHSLSIGNNSRLRVPKLLSRYAQVCLTALAESGLGGKISLCGALAMAYYYEYRATQDVDAWWEETTNEKDKRKVLLCLEEALQVFGSTERRHWGDVDSLELIPAGETKVIFSFQIAQRSARLEKSTQTPWPDSLHVDSLADLLASKMVALVERGAPRDFRDIFTFCQAGLVSPNECWLLWRHRQELADSDTDANRAKMAIQTHLARIASYRPLDKLEPEERLAASKLRNWFGSVFIDAALD